ELIVLALEPPQLQRQHARAGLEQRRQIHVVGAEADTVVAQRRARRLVQALDLLGDALALDHAQRFHELERDAAGDPGQILGARRGTRVKSAARDSGSGGPSSFSTCALLQRSSRACTASREAPVRCSSATMRTRGASVSSPATSLPTASPTQRIVPSEASTNW